MKFIGYILVAIAAVCGFVAGAIVTVIYLFKPR
jgi:hypothetical protein